MTIRLVSVFSAILISFFFTTAVDATTKESMQVKLYDPNLRMSHQQMLDLLKRVNLTGHGYSKEENKKLVRLPGSDKKFFEKSLLFYKETSCSHGLQKVDRELQQLLPGIFQRDLVKKINKEIDSKNLTEMKRCKVGLEVHFKEAEGCGGSKNKSRRRKKRGCNWCVLCWNASLAN